MTAAATTRVPPSRVLLVASFGAFLAFLDATIVNVAFPSIRDSFSDTTISELSWVLNAYNIVFAASLILCGRLTDLVGRRRSFVAGVALFTVASAACGVRAVGRAADPRPGRPGVRRRDARAGLARPGHRSLPGGAARARHRGLGCVRRRRRGARATHRRRPGAARRLALGLPGEPPLRPGRGVGGAPPAGREPGARPAHDARPRRRRPAGGQPGAAQPRHRQGCATGAGPARRCSASFVGAAVALVLFVVSSRRHRAPMLDPMLLRLRSFDLGSAATVAAGFGFYAYLLTNVLWLQYVWGYDVLRAGLALVPGAIVAALVAARLGPLAERYGYRVFVVPGAIVWAAAYLWYHQRVGLQPAFWAEWMPGQVLSGIGVGATLPLLGSATLAAVPGGRYATASAVASSARQLGGVSASRSSWSSSATPRPPTVVDVAARGLGAVHRRVPGRRRARPAAGPDPLRRGGRGRRRRPAPGRAPAEPAGRVGGSRARSAPTDAVDLSELPLFSALPDGGPQPAGARDPCRRPAGRRGADPPGRPARVGVRRAHRPARGARRRRGGARARPGTGAGRAGAAHRRAALGHGARPPRHDRSSRSPARRSRTCSPPTPRRHGSCSARWPSGCARPGAVARPRRRPSGCRWSPSSGSARPSPPRQVAAVGEALGRRLRQHLRVVDARGGQPRRAGPRRARPRPGAARRARPPTARMPPWREFCLRQADAVVLVATGGDAGARGGAVTGPGPPPRAGAARRGAEPRAAGGLGGGHRRLAAHPRHRRPRGRACGPLPTGSPGARSGWPWPAAGRAPSPTSACCASSRTPACTSTG